LEAEREVAVWDKDAMAGVMFIGEARAIDVSHSCRQKCGYLMWDANCYHGSSSY
jgi:hypothetical protein